MDAGMDMKTQIIRAKSSNKNASVPTEILLAE